MSKSEALANVGAQLPVVQRIIRAAVDLAGTGYPDQRYLDAILPQAGGSQDYDGRTMSSCGLVWEGVLRAAGVPAPYLSVPYARRIGQTIRNSIDYAKQVGAWVPCARWNPDDDVPGPGPGDAVIMGTGDPTWAIAYTAAQHLSIIVAPGLSVDGGQPGRGGPNACKYRRRQYVEVPGALWAAEEGADLLPERTWGPVSKGRRVYGIIRGSLLPVGLLGCSLWAIGQRGRPCIAQTLRCHLAPTPLSKTRA